MYSVCTSTRIDLKRCRAREHRKRDAEGEFAPRLTGYVAGRHGLRLPWAVGRSQPKTGGERAVAAQDAAAGKGWVGTAGTVRTGSR